MSTVSLRQQFNNYKSLFKQLFVDYYHHQTKAFWLIQLLMLVSTVTGIFWVLSIILGVGHLQNPDNTQGFKYLMFSWVFNLPIWQWLLLASIAGIISAWSLYASIQKGVASVLAFQKDLALRCLKKVSHSDYESWPELFDQSPRLVLLRILRQGIQLSGLVTRRMTRSIISLLTFFLAIIVLTYLDAALLVLLLPLIFLYFAALYYINRYASRISTQAAEILPKTSQKFSNLVSRILNKNLSLKDKRFMTEFDESLFMKQAELKYQRRLAEVHVSWLNTLFVVFGIALIVVYVAYIQASDSIDWQHLLFFLITLRYGASSLQQISATTVAFSRFLPEIQLVFRLLNVEKTSQQQKHKISNNTFIYLESARVEAFEIQQLYRHFTLGTDVKFEKLSTIRAAGLAKFLNNLANNNPTVLVDNNSCRMQRLIQNHIEKISPFYQEVIIISHSNDELVIKQSLTEFLNHNFKQTQEDFDVEIDTYE